MPSLFSRRRGSSQPPMSRSTVSSAAVAASQAYLNTQKSNATLSSAAAAAALRSLTTTPEPVANVQTKRMMRRGSVSSVTSTNGRGGGGAPALLRRDSQGSMTDRTFRSPSPGRPNTQRSNSARNSQAPDAPPVPVIPQSISKVHQRSSSVDAPRRAFSPVNHSQSSNDRHSVQALAQPARKTRLSNVAELEEQVERQDSRNSINFSRPISSPPASPTSPSPTTANKYTHGTGSWFAGPKGALVSSSEGSQAREGTNSEEMETYTVYDPNTRTFVSRQRVVQKKTQPPSPTLIIPEGPAPGTYDPNTRRILPIPRPQQDVLTSQLATRSPTAKSPYIEPPPRNPKRLSSESLPGLAQKQKPVVESGASRQDLGKIDAGGDPAISNNIAKPRKGVSHERHVSLDVPRASIEPSEVRRQVSVSPHRARFSPSPVSDAVIHKPPSRAMSPVKSAMKHSPASSVRAVSPLPLMAVGAKTTAVDQLDTDSQTSRDETPKTKRSVRVSFDERAADISTMTSSTPAIGSSTIDRKRIEEDEDNSDTMTPRPALPSFGSVRNIRSTPPPTEASSNTGSELQGTSSDHAIGAIIASTATSTIPTEAVESKVTTADNSAEEVAPTGGPVSNAQDQPGRDAFPDINLLPPTPSAEEQTRELSEDKPGEGQMVHDVNRDSMEGIVLPGGWARGDVEQDVHKSAVSSNKTDGAATVTNDTHDSRPANLLHAITEDTDDEFSDAAEDLTEVEEGGFASLDAIANSPIVVKKDTERSPEAMMSSPTLKRTAIATSDSTDTAPAQSIDDQDWSATTAFWSKLSQTQRQQIEENHLAAEDDGENVSVNPKRFSTTSLKSAMKSGAETAKPVPTIATSEGQMHTMRTSMRDARAPAAPTSAPAQFGERSMRRSMRDGSGPAPRTTPAIDDAARPQSAYIETTVPTRPRPLPRPMSSSSSVMSNTDRGQSPLTMRPSTRPRSESLQSQTNSISKRGGAFSSKLEQKYTNDSDSESSFRKKKRSTASTVDAQGRYNMMRSMRSQDTEPAEVRRPSSPDTGRRGGRALSIRSLSPSGSFFGSRNKPESIRQSIRGSAEPRSTRMSMRGAPMNSAATTRSKTGGASSRFKTRFIDSDDEDDRRIGDRTQFQSRFADSDDEPMTPTTIAANLTPVRGIPRRANHSDGDSTDLEDEDELAKRKGARNENKSKSSIVPDPADVEKAMAAARRKLGIAEPDQEKPFVSQEGQTLQKGSLRDDPVESIEAGPRVSARQESSEPVEKKKRGFMNSILRRNKSSTQSVPQVGGRIVESAPPVPQIPASVIAETQTNGSLPNSPTRRPTRRLQRGSSNMSTATAPPQMSQAYSTAGDHWPLPPVPALPEDAYSKVNGVRPMTSDGTTLQNGRGGKAVRIADFVDGEDGEQPGREVYSSRTGRKKKFGLLRRAFGLND